ncbi:MAG: Maf family protein [Chloroflexota bacterium]
MRFILASSSPRRRELLASLNISFDIIKPEIDETQRPGEAPDTYVRRLSQDKAATVAASVQPPITVLAADTIVIDDTRDQSVILGKPANTAEARETLRRLRGRTHTVCTAFTLLVRHSATSEKRITEAVRTAVTMRDYTDAEIETYIASGDPFDKAGSYAIQHPEFRPVARLDGDYHNVVGLPLDAVRAALNRVR